MNPRLKLLAGVVILLATANALRWAGPPIPAGSEFGRERFPLALFTPEDFKLGPAWDNGAAPETTKRDLFDYARTARVARSVVTPVRPVAATHRTTTGLLPDRDAQQELDQIKLVGLVFREGRGQAYLVKGDEVFLVSVGEPVGPRLRVEQISADAVELRDTTTQTSAWIKISGN